MIQRVQSIFFLLTGLCFGGEFIAPFASADKTSSGIFYDGLYNVQDHIGLMIIAGLGGLLSIIALFLYKNRGQQMKLGYLVTTIAIILPIISILIFMNHSKDMPDILINDGVGAYLPLGMVVFSLLALRYVKKDEQLVKSMDRLR